MVVDGLGDNMFFITVRVDSWIQSKRLRWMPAIYTDWRTLYSP